MRTNYMSKRKGCSRYNTIDKVRSFDSTSIVSWTPRVAMVADIYSNCK